MISAAFNSQTVLRFEPVIMFRLQSSPISHFLHPLDPVLQPEQSLDVTQVSTPQVHSIAPMCAPAYAAQDDWADRSQVPGFVTVIRNPGITFCWLTTHRVNYDAWHIDNLLRLCRAEVDYLRIASIYTFFSNAFRVSLGKNTIR